MGAAAVRHGVPALVGGDWSTCFVEGRAAPESEEWAAQLRHVARYHPTELDCYRYRSGMPPVDFLAVVAPTVSIGGLRFVHILGHWAHILTG